MLRRGWLLWWVSCTSGACARPPPAPVHLDALMGYLFAHSADTDDRALVDGCANLQGWLAENLPATLEGYEVFDLDTEAMAVLGGVPEHLVGASVGHNSPHPADGLGGINAIPVGTDLAADPTEGQGRIYRTDPNCFLTQDCDWLESEEWTADDSLPLGLSVEVHWYQNWRWVELDSGMAMLQRFWLLEPIEFNVSFISVDSQYFLWVFLPEPNGSSVSIQGTWISATLTGAPVPESVALSLVVDEMSANATNLDARYAPQ